MEPIQSQIKERQQNLDLGGKHLNIQCNQHLIINNGHQVVLELGPTNWMIIKIILTILVTST